MLKSKPFEISVTASYFSLLLPEDIIRPFLDMNHKRVKVKAVFESKELTFHGAIQKKKWKPLYDVQQTTPKRTWYFS